MSFRESVRENEGEIKQKRVGEEEKRLGLAWEGCYRSFRRKTRRYTSKNGGLAWRQREETNFPSLCIWLATMAIIISLFFFGSKK